MYSVGSLIIDYSEDSSTVESLYRVGVTMFDKACVTQIKLQVTSNEKVKLIEHTFKRYYEHTFNGNLLYFFQNRLSKKKADLNK